MDNTTPWRNVFHRLGLSQADLARGINRDRAKISRALKDEQGYINGHDQEALIKLASSRNVKLTLADMMPARK